MPSDDNITMIASTINVSAGTTYMTCVTYMYQSRDSAQFWLVHVLLTPQQRATFGKLFLCISNVVY